MTHSEKQQEIRESKSSFSPMRDPIKMERILFQSKRISRKRPGENRNFA